MSFTKIKDSHTIARTNRAPPDHRFQLNQGTDSSAAFWDPNTAENWRFYGQLSPRHVIGVVRIFHGPEFAP
jgi:hypothetical protein